MIQFNNQLEKLRPWYYQGIFDFQKLNETQEIDFDLMTDEITKVEINNFVLTANITGVEMFELILGILPAQSESLDFRKERIIQRLSLTSLYTIRYLFNMLNRIIGIGKWNVLMDYANYTLYLDTAVENQSWYHEVQILMTKIKPANIIFLRRPLVNQNILVAEEIKQTQLTYNYKLGTTWNLGLKPFVSYAPERTVKMFEDTGSIKQEFLDIIATEGLGYIDKVLINDTLEILSANFVTATSLGGIITIEYLVTAAMGQNPINNIKFLHGTDILTEVDVYIPIEIDDVQVKHTIKIEEGVNV